ncbi:MAG TPA: ATP-dependent DNA helicase [Candidatus Sulfotelmatobacter sp.]|nr:ATP-dependent DNA helicase [Candidatus Sulfotelmatobacter sp.]
MASVAQPVYQVSVRELVEFVLRRGDLGGEHDFVGPQRALAGIRGHQKVQRSRPAGYQKELALVWQVETDDFILRVQGRIDGLWSTSKEVVLEEIKTIQGRWDHQADPLHWAQAQCYGFIYARDQGWDAITLQLTYLELETGQLTELRQRFGLAELSAFFEQTTAVYLQWVRERHQWCQKRDQSIRALNFPFPDYRPGQRKLAVAVYRVMAGGGRLFLEAPTGIGKTMSVLFPAVKALGEGNLERIFYLTARTVGRAVAEQACAALQPAGLHLHTLTLTAKEKICLQAGQPCDPRTCRLARGYYDRRQPAMREALGHAAITRPVLETVSRQHQVCPFELSLDLSSWVDAVICDYNYVFDPKVYLRRHFGEQAGEYAFLVDEAHNLVDRARDMFSAELNTRDIQEVRRAIKTAVPRCARALSKLSAALRKLGGPAAPPFDPADPTDPALELNLFPAGAPGATTSGPAASAIQPPQLRTEPDRACTRQELPADLLPILETALQEAEAWLAQNQPAEFRESLLQLYFRLHSFRRTAELYDERYVTILQPGAAVRVRLFCLDPSFLLRRALARGKAAVFFSATLTPIDYYRELLGGSSEDPVLQLPSPFPPQHLAVLVQDRIRTQFKARAGSLTEVVHSIGALVQGRPGNYLVYLPSYQYLTAVQEQFQALHPALRVLVQRPGMNETERDTFLAAFAAEHRETLVGFAVLGGIFGEGIDLVGDRLIGAIIVGVGLPQLCAERDLIRDYFQHKAESGFDYAYTFPGMNRVLQATGRVIRSETDRGVVLLIDARFAEGRYRRLFPGWWQPAPVKSLDDIRQAVSRFWQTG